jgi:hypothetical protein
MTIHAKDTWTTPAEASAFRTTPSYAETQAFLRRLANAAPDTIRLETFGTTPEGRPMTVVIAAKDGDLTPGRARAAGKPVVLLQAGIHPGEIEGKDAATKTPAPISGSTRTARRKWVSAASRNTSTSTATTSRPTPRKPARG